MSFILVAIGVGFSFWFATISISGAITMVIVMSCFGLATYFIAWLQGLTYILLFSDRIKLRDQGLVWRWRTIPLDEIVDVVVSKTPFYKILVFTHDHQITIVSRHSKPYTLQETFVLNADPLVAMLEQEILRRGKTQSAELPRCNTCKAATSVHRCPKCGEFNCDGCTDAQECLPCRMDRLLGRATSCILISLLATAAFVCIALVIRLEYYSFLGGFFTGLFTFPYGIASLLAAMTLLPACRARLHDKRAAMWLLVKTTAISILASMLVLTKMAYFTIIIMTRDTIMRGLMAGEFGFAGLFFVATFFVSRFKASGRDMIVQRIWLVIVWAYFYTIIAQFISLMLMYYLPKEMILTAATIVGASSLAVIILATFYLGGTTLKETSKRKK